MSIFGLFKGKKAAQSADTAAPAEIVSAIQKVSQQVAEGYGIPPQDTVPGFDGEMTDAEYHTAVDALFPVRLNDFAEVLKSGADPFPVKTDMVRRDVPTMDEIPGANVPGAIGAGSKRMYPPRRTQGMHAGLEGGGFAMLPDPLLRFPINPRVLKHFQSRIWITYTGCAIIATHEIVNRACAIPAEDAIAHGYKLVCSTSKHKHNEQNLKEENVFLEKLKSAADSMGLNEACVKLNYKKKVFGVGIAIPRVEFKEGYPSPSDASGKTQYSYADEYDPKAIKPDSFKGFAVIDPHWLTYQWDQESRIDPTSPHFLEPTWIKVVNKRIHRSWCIRVVNSELPDIFKPVYLYGGLSLTQMIYERVWCADKLANEAPLLAMTKRLLIADGNLDQMIADPRHTNKFFNWINYFRDNFSIFVKKPSSNVTQLDTSLAELTPLTMAQYQLVAAIAQIPVTKLLKNVPTGLQSTGDYEWDDYAQSLQTIQQKDYTPLCKMFFECYCASNYPNREDLQFDIDWNPIDVPKADEVTQMASTSAQYVAHLINTGVVTVAEARDILRKSGLTTFKDLPIEVPEILRKIEDAKDPSSQGGMGGGGMPGMGAPGGEGGMPPRAEEQPQQPQVSQEVLENDRIFKDAMTMFLKETGNWEDNPQPEEGRPSFRSLMEQEQGQQQAPGQPNAEPLQKKPPQGA